jgi:hypothetical protein
MSDILSRQKTITSAGVSYTLADVVINGPVSIKALPTNTGVVYLGDDGTGVVSSGTGYPLSASGEVTLDVGNLSKISVTSTASGDKIAILTKNI